MKEETEPLLPKPRRRVFGLAWMVIVVILVPLVLFGVLRRSFNDRSREEETVKISRRNSESKWIVYLSEENATKATLFPEDYNVLVAPRGSWDSLFMFENKKELFVAYSSPRAALFVQTRWADIELLRPAGFLVENNYDELILYTNYSVAIFGCRTTNASATPSLEWRQPATLVFFPFCSATTTDESFFAKTHHETIEGVSVKTAMHNFLSRRIGGIYVQE